jgi:hypothetical protein
MIAMPTRIVFVSRSVPPFCRSKRAFKVHINHVPVSLGRPPGAEQRTRPPRGGVPTASRAVRFGELKSGHADCEIGATYSWCGISGSGSVFQVRYFRARQLDILYR